ncbi:sensor histidine kinase [Pontibacter liquoris]|uniref:sensor histidine kinase n=1 Tax=Pontibacter liquoris TaxID=2905677 RepID=UPI001FA6E624|nr:sensor histidine kinase [Pontibacter liquoris]
MLRPILKFSIANELDIVLAYRRAIQLSERLGIAMANQTKFSTAVSEICRNVVEYVGNGVIQFNLVEDAGYHYLEALVTDRGRGIGNLDFILNQAENLKSGSRGTGILNARKLVDQFSITSDTDKGTKVMLRRKLPAKAPGLTKALLDQWTIEFNQEVNISPYAEIKRQNINLLEILEQLRIRNLEAEQRLQEIRRLNGQLQQSNNEIGELLIERDIKNKLLQKINNNLDAFAHTVTHDLRSPLQNITGLADALASTIENQNYAEAVSLLPLLRGQTQKMENLITGILSLSLAGHRNVEKVYVAVATLVEQVIASLIVPYNCKIIISPNLPELFTQEINLHQVFSNLLVNAIKYNDNPNGGEIRILFEKHPDRLLFSVQDNGPGIPAEHQAHIFEMFNRGSNYSRSDSSGLGLAIVKKVVTERGGNVWVESQGRGSKFSFTWPVEDLVPDEV